MRRSAWGQRADNAWRRIYCDTGRSGVSPRRSPRRENVDRVGAHGAHLHARFPLCPIPDKSRCGLQTATVHPKRHLVRWNLCFDASAGLDERAWRCLPRYPERRSGRNLSAGRWCGDGDGTAEEGHSVSLRRSTRVRQPPPGFAAGFRRDPVQDERRDQMGRRQGLLVELDLGHVVLACYGIDCDEQPGGDSLEDEAPRGASRVGGVKHEEVKHPVREMGLPPRTRRRIAPGVDLEKSNPSGASREVHDPGLLGYAIPTRESRRRSRHQRGSARVMRRLRRAARAPVTSAGSQRDR